MGPSIRRVILVGLIACAVSSAAAASAAEPKRVMVLHSFGTNFKPWNEYARTIRNELERHSPWPLDITDHSLVTARSDDENPEGPFVDYLRALYASRPLDLIVCIGAPAAAFVQRHRPQLFAKTPMVFTAVEYRRVNYSALTPNDTVVAVRIDYLAAFENILRVLPDTKNVAIIVGTSPIEKFWKDEVAKEVLEPLRNRLALTWTDSLSFEEILKHAAKLPPRTAIFWELMFVDAAGVVHEGGTALNRLHATANAPIFSYDDAFFDYGLVGGPMHSVAQGSSETAAVAVRILGGEKAGDIRLPPLPFATPRFNWREMRRWGISENRLPPGSEVYFREPTVWEQYRVQIAVILSALLLQAAMVAWLIYEHRRRSLAEVQSHNAVAELAHVNRLETAAHLSASIAHEINQPITGIVLKASAALRWLAAGKSDDNKMRDLLTDIVSAGQRAGDIIGSVRAMFKKGMNAKAAINLNNLINTVLALLQLDLQKEGVRVETQLDQQLPSILGDPVQLQQVMLNLIVNAADAMRAQESRVLTVQSRGTVSGTVKVSIEDSGTGIGKADMSRIFDPLFTTKAGGMGMGLSICRSIIENHGGKIWVSNAAQGGAVFEFELPAAAGVETVQKNGGLND